MDKSIKEEKRIRRHKKIRAKVSGTSSIPRLSVFKSNKIIYTQLIDDENAVTLASAKGSDATKVAQDMAKKASDKKVKSVVFDRGGYIYTGKIETLAEALRKSGLKL